MRRDDHAGHQPEARDDRRPASRSTAARAIAPALAPARTAPAARARPIAAQAAVPGYSAGMRSGSPPGRWMSVGRGERLGEGRVRGRGRIHDPHRLGDDLHAPHPPRHAGTPRPRSPPRGPAGRGRRRSGRPRSRTTPSAARRQLQDRPQERFVAGQELAAAVERDRPGHGASPPGRGSVGTVGIRRGDVLHRRPVADPPPPPGPPPPPPRAGPAPRGRAPPRRARGTRPAGSGRGPEPHPG